jgi:hypothetical protein
LKAQEREGGWDRPKVFVYLLQHLV